MKSVRMCRVPLRRAMHHSARLTAAVPSPELDSIIRVDHAGELGADRIYAGQMAVLGKTKMGPLIQHMWDQEKRHKATFEDLIRKHRVRPTALVPIWNVAGFVLGAGTALMGEKAAMACTVAVESVIVDHYNDQLRKLMADPEANKELMETIQQFRDEEQEHHDTGLDHGAEQAPMYKALSEVIKMGCRTAIAISKGLFCTATSDLTPARAYSTTAGREPGSGWDLLSAVCVERKPLLARPLTDLEERHAALLAQIELEGSCKSNHEMRHDKDLKQAELLKESNLTEVDVESTIAQTAQDFEDASTEELRAFKCAPRVTPDDPKSIRRKLDSHLLLLVKQNIGDRPLWVVPSGVRAEGETMRQTAERVLREACGEDLSVAFLGNAPCGFYKYKYPKRLGLPAVGAKVFFFKALHVSGQVGTPADFHWAARNELSTLLTNDKYLKSVKSILIDEEQPDEAIAQRQ